MHLARAVRPIASAGFLVVVLGGCNPGCCIALLADAPNVDASAATGAAADAARPEGESVVATSRDVAAIALDDTHVYWLDAADKKLRRAPKVGGDAQELATFDFSVGIGALVVAGAAAFVSNANVFSKDRVYRVAAAGGAPVELAAKGTVTALAAATSGVEVYAGCDPGGILARPKLCVIRPGAAAPELLAEVGWAGYRTGQLINVAADATHVWTIGATNVKSTTGSKRDIRQRGVFRYAIDQRNVEAGPRMEGELCGQFLVDDANMYCTTGAPVTLLRAPKSLDPKFQTIATLDAQAYAATHDAEHLYLAGMIGLVRVRKDAPPGDGAGEVLADRTRVNTFSGVAVDADAIYYGHGGAVVRRKKR